MNIFIGKVDRKSSKVFPLRWVLGLDLSIRKLQIDLEEY